MSLDSKQFKKVAVAAAQKADAKKATDILLLDLKASGTGLSDYLLILSGNSHVHMRAIRESIEDALEKFEVRSIHRDGTKSEHWIALDFGGLMVHIFHEGSRHFYSLERLWEEARVVSWQNHRSKHKKRKSASRGS